MGKIAFIFPGQGAQYPGMGRALQEISSAAAEVFRMADKIRPGTSEQCFEGPAELLQETNVTQPCMFAVELAAAAALEEEGVHGDFAAGFSLGEMAALSYGRVVDFSTMFGLVCRRGELMQQCADRYDTSMAAVVKLDKETVESICAGFEGVYPVNYNCPGQITVAGMKSRMVDFAVAVKRAGGRALPLKVSGGFHSPFMREAANSFAALLRDVEFKSSGVTLYSNVTGKAYEGDIRHLLAKQICSPVQWESIVRNMITMGADTFIEVGPGNVLQGLIRKIDPNVRVFGVSDAATLRTTVRGVKA